MHVYPSHEIPDILLIEPQIFADERGFLYEAYQARKYADAGIPTSFAQDNHSASRQGVLRGLHYQIRQPQGKLVRVVAGEVFDVAVDLRKSSPTFARWTGQRLSADNRRQIWIPPGFAHGFYVLSPWAEVLYKASDFYDPAAERTLLWNDPGLNIDWPLIDGQPPLVSPKDARGASFAQAEVYA